jgi:hypothetical protein
MGNSYYCNLTTVTVAHGRRFFNPPILRGVISQNYLPASPAVPDLFAITLTFLVIPLLRATMVGNRSLLLLPASQPASAAPPSIAAQTTPATSSPSANLYLIPKNNP